MDLLPDYKGQTCSECGEQKLSTEFAQPLTLSSPSLKCLQCLHDQTPVDVLDLENVAKQLEAVTQQKAWTEAYNQNPGLDETKGSEKVIC